MTLNQTWKNCLRQWKWIAASWKDGYNINSLKEEWKTKHNFPLRGVNCFFCDYDVEHNVSTDKLPCKQCPGRLVSKSFSCCCNSYHYYCKPKKFYQKLLQLDVKRKEINNGKIKSRKNEVAHK